MLRRNCDSVEMSCAISDVIEDSISKMREGTNHVHNLLICALDEDKQIYAERRFLESLIYDVVNVSSGKYNEDYTLNKERVRDIVREVRSISDILGNNTSFTKHLEEMMKKSQFFKKIKEEFTTTAENILSIMKICNEKDVVLLKEYYKNFFEICLSQITPEFYFILKEADIENLISRYNKNDRDINVDLTYGVVNPLCAVLETLLIEEKSRFFDLFVKSYDNK